MSETGPSLPEEVTRSEANPSPEGIRSSRDADTAALRDHIADKLGMTSESVARSPQEASSTSSVGEAEKLLSALDESRQPNSNASEGPFDRAMRLGGATSTNELTGKSRTLRAMGSAVGVLDSLVSFDLAGASESAKEFGRAIRGKNWPSRGQMEPPQKRK